MLVTIITLLAIIAIAIAAVAIVKFKKRMKCKGFYDNYHLGEMTTKDIPAGIKKNNVRRKKQHIKRNITAPGYPS